MLPFERHAPMKMLAMEPMTQASEIGAKTETNLTPTATTIVRASMKAVPYNRKLFHGSWWMSPKIAICGAMYSCDVVK